MEDVERDTDRLWKGEESSKIQRRTKGQNQGGRLVSRSVKPLPQGVA